MKKGLVFYLIIFLIFLTGIISAQFGYSYGYGFFSLEGFLNSFSDTTIVLGCLFFIFFCFIMFSTGKIFKGNRASSAVVSFALSILIIYGLYRSGIDFTSIFYQLAFFGDLIRLLVVILFVIFTIWAITKWGWGIMLISLGGIIWAAAFIFDWYSKGSAIIFGLILIIIGIILNRKKANQGREFKGRIQ